jgi:hypothetical protein
LQRYSVAITHNQETSEQLYCFAEKQGDKWLERNQKLLDAELTIPYKVLRWSRWLHHQEFTAYRDKVLNLYRVDAEYKSEVDRVIRFCEPNFIVAI